MIGEGLIFVPSHGEPDEKPESEIEFNINTILKIKVLIEDYLNSERTLEEIVSYIHKRLGINIEDLSLYYLYKSAIKGYLTWLHNDDLMDIIIVNGRKIYKMKKR
jgi:hypothetical protein